MYTGKHIEVTGLVYKDFPEGGRVLPTGVLPIQPSAFNKGYWVTVGIGIGYPSKEWWFTADELNRAWKAGKIKQVELL